MIQYGGHNISNSKALTKIQSLIFMAVIVIAAVVGGSAYILLSGQNQSSETVKIGILADLDGDGKSLLQGAVLAVEQVNSEGGVLGRNFEVVSQDDDSGSGGGDVSVATNAFNRLVGVDKADFVISGCGPTLSSVYQEIMYQHQKILFHGGDPSDQLTQKVLDDYDKYKYYFRYGVLLNKTVNTVMTADSVLACREYTGFNKVAILSHDLGVGDYTYSGLVAHLKEYGFDVVHTALIPLNTMDFSSFFAQAEAAGAEILYPIIFGQAGILFVKEYYDRQSPMVMWGLPNLGSDFWEVSEGKCEWVTTSSHAIAAGYPLTSRVMPTREAYFDMWDEEIDAMAAFVYDVVRFILPDAIKRAGTFETGSLIAALERTEIETSLARKLVFTSSHDVLVVKDSEDFWLFCLFQWQDGTQVPVYPPNIMDEAGVTYMYPDWIGPWN